MKTTLTAIMITIFLLTPVLCFSAYRIHLKDGREFTTDRYWEDGDQIKFERFGGVIGMQKELVRKIEEVEGEAKDGGSEKEKVADHKVIEGQEKGAQEKGEKRRGKDQREITTAGEKNVEQEKDDKIEAILEQKRRLLEEKQNVASAFKDAKARDDRAKKDEYWRKLLAVQNKLSQLRKQVMALNEGRLPPSWDSVMQ